MPEMEERCSMSGCGNSRPELPLHPFPADFKQCLLWMQICGRLEHLEDFSYLGSSPFARRMICSRHFTDADYLDPHNKSMGLKDKTVPFVNGETVGKVKRETFMEDGSNISVELLKAVDDQLIALKRKNLSETEFVEEQAKIRRQKNALRAALKRKAETSEQRTERKLKDIIRSAKRRQSETELQRQIRRYNDAVRAAYRRSNETEDQRRRRRMVDIIRAARRRQSETPEQRASRLKADRERAARRRLLKKITESGSELSSDSFGPNLIEPHISLNENVVHHFASIGDQP
ncbi:PREDICTED: uncharacterized protein LOC108562424 [Nicrophorus vespilloides]|uniref:Uncharacterized protein LOC108562424 n=1 Tax=Nicrophorus vespilloides TaxID=110193 RepID=A0ABM1MNT8_NICVS|nr:PREDICTED: uncharacterized protein LOC108562424 [Nicrophorus vespilloides]